MSDVSKQQHIEEVTRLRDAANRAWEAAWVFREESDRGTAAVADVAWILWSNVRLLRKHFHAELDAPEGGSDPTQSQ